MRHRSIGYDISLDRSVSFSDDGSLTGKLLYSIHGIRRSGTAGIKRNMDEQRIHQISVEMLDLLEQQKRLLNASKPLMQVGPEEMERYAERNQRLRDLCRELIEV